MNDVVTHLKGDKSDLERTLSEGEGLAKGFADRVTTIFAGLAASIAAAFTARALFNFLKESVAEASEAEDAMAKLNAMIKITGGSAGVTAEQIKDLGTQIQLTTRYTDDSVVATAALLMRYKSLQGEGLERTIRLSADLAALQGGDLRSSAQMLGRALESPEHASRMLRMAGITLTEAQEKQIKSFVELGEKAKAQEVLFTLLEERVKGLAVEMGDTLSGQTAKLNNALGEVKETIGGAIIPLLKELMPLLQTGGDAYAALGEEIAASIAAAKTDGGFEGINETLLDTVTILATVKEHWELLTTGIAKGGAEAAQATTDWFENMAEKTARFMASADEGESGNATMGVIANLIGIGKSHSDPLGVDDVVKTLDQQMSEINTRVQAARKRIEDDMKARRDARKKAGEPGEVNADAGSDAAIEAAVKAMGQEAEARARRDVELHGPRNRMKRGDEAGFGQGAGKGKEDDLFKAQVVGIEELHSRISQSAASESPAKKVEDAVIKSGIKVAEAVERVEKILERDSQMMTEQNKILTERSSAPVLA